MNLILASSPVELVSACVIMRHLKMPPASLLFNLGLNREPERVRQLVNRLDGYWKKITFIEPAEIRSSRDLSFGAIHRLWLELKDSSRYTEVLRELLYQSIGEDAVKGRGRGIRVYLNHFHHHIFYILGLLPEAERVYYPHGLGQPRERQLTENAFLFSPRGVGTMIRTWPKQLNIRRSLYLVRVWLWITGRSRLPFPFDGVDHALVFTCVRPLVSWEQIPEDLVRKTLREIAIHLDSEASLSDLFSNVVMEHTCIVLLPELDSQFPNQNYLVAIEALMNSVESQGSIQNFVLKLHPRSSYAKYECLLKDLRKRLPGRQILAWPKAVMSLQTELVVATYPVRSVASIGSCALPPSASFGVPHYVSLRAAQLFDSGWPRKGTSVRNYPSYTSIVTEFEDAGLALLLE